MVKASKSDLFVADEIGRELNQCPRGTSAATSWAGLVADLRRREVKATGCTPPAGR
jgi:hypothetical protein